MGERCASRSFLDRLECRRCGDARGQHAKTIPGRDAVKAGTAAPKAPGPSRAAGAQMAAGRQQQQAPQQQGQQQRGRPPTKIEAAQAAVAAGERAGLPAAVLDAMREHLQDVAREAHEAKPLGARLDSAQARLKRADQALERAQKRLAEVEENVANAEAEVEDAAEEVAALQQEAANATAVEQGPTDGEEMAATLAKVLGVIEQTWVPGTQAEPPERLARVIQEAKGVLSRSPTRTPQRRSTSAARTVVMRGADEMEAEEGGGPSVKEENRSQPATPLTAAASERQGNQQLIEAMLERLDGTGRRDDAEYAAEVRRQLGPGRSSPY